MAGIVLRDKARELGLEDQLNIASAGVSSEEQGNPMDPRAVRVLDARGYNVADPLVAQHRARKTSTEEVSGADLILPMTASHSYALIQRFGAPPERVYMWRWFETQDEQSISQTGVHIGPDLADPWYGGPEDFEQALDELEKSAQAIVEKLNRRAV